MKGFLKSCTKTEIHMHQLPLDSISADCFVYICVYALRECHDQKHSPKI